MPDSNPFPRLPCGWSHVIGVECPEGWTDQDHRDAIRAKNNGEHWIHPSKRKSEPIQSKPVERSRDALEVLDTPLPAIQAAIVEKVKRKAAKQKAAATYAAGCPACEARRAADQARLKRFRDNKRNVSS